MQVSVGLSLYVSEPKHSLNLELILLIAKGLHFKLIVTKLSTFGHFWFCRLTKKSLFVCLCCLLNWDQV